jgi:uncharacterized membrane protein
MLVVFPLGLLGISPLWDILRLVTDSARWSDIAFWTIVAGIASALVAAVPGFIDWLAIPGGTRAKRIGLWHMATNLVVVALFGLSLWLRANTEGGYAYAGVGAFLPAWIGVALALVSGWLGGELVERLGVGVDEEAGVNAPSSLATPHRVPTAPTGAR